MRPPCPFGVVAALFAAVATAATQQSAPSWREWLAAHHERLRQELATLPFADAKQLLTDAIQDLGPPPREEADFPQNKIEHMVVLFVENRGSDHIWGCMLGDKPGFTGIPTRLANGSLNPDRTDSKTGCGTATLVCNGHYQGTKFSREQLPIKAAISDHFGVHNRMFTSVSGPSWPNHNFAQSGTSCGISSNVMYNRCGGPFPQFPQMTIYDSLALAHVPFGLYVNM